MSPLTPPHPLPPPPRHAARHRHAERCLGLPQRHYRIRANHIRYIRGLLWFWAHDPATGPDLHAEMEVLSHSLTPPPPTPAPLSLTHTLSPPHTMHYSTHTHAHTIPPPHHRCRPWAIAPTNTAPHKHTLTTPPHWPYQLYVREAKRLTLADIYKHVCVTCV